MMSHSKFLAFFWLLTCLAGAVRADDLDLSSAEVVLASPPNERLTQAARMLVEEIEVRTGIRLPVTERRGDAARHAILLARAASNPAGAADGFHLRTEQRGETTDVILEGNDDRGVFFAVGKLLRLLHMAPGKLALAENTNLHAAPKYALRGHQLGYRPKTNSYDAWDLPIWEQYYRDLIVFGTNAVELLPPRTDDAETSPHFPRSPMEMMVGMSRLADEYALDVWIWYPAMAADYADNVTVEAELQAWEKVFQQLPRIDAVFVPGGDPGHTRPRHLLAYLRRAKEALRRSHPRAQMWVSPQSFSQEWLEEFIKLLQDEQPDWLDGVVFGPQVRISLPELRSLTPARYPIRHYPDITHSRQCEYPVPDWDVALAVTHGRECINPRPLGQATIFRQLQPQTIGFLTYSEGCNDDVNKTIWSALGWDPETPVIDILRDYSGYFINSDSRDDFAQGLLALERNWQAPLVANEQIETTLRQFQAMELRADARQRANWRFQQGLYRAYYDAYERRRWLQSTADETAALDILRGAATGNIPAAVDAAERVMDQGASSPVAPELRARIAELADDLYNSIRMQTSVAKYQAIDVDRGATLDTVDYPLNNRLWLQRRFAEMRGASDEAQRRQKLDEILNWTNPGPGGFYDDLGNVARQPHLVVGEGFSHDPAFLRSAHVGFAGPDNAADADGTSTERWRVSWLDHAESMNDAPLVMHYDDLDPTATYRVRVTYAGDAPERKIRLTANEGIEIHPFLEKPAPIRPIAFLIPRSATASGKLTLRWYREPGRGDNGRGCQVSEVWLEKVTSTSPTR